MNDAKRLLYDVRARRVWPGRDEKILTSWNGLMIAAFAKAGAAFGEVKYVEAAARAANYLLTQMRDADGRLFRTAGVGLPPKLMGYLEDYAFLADALVTLYESTFDVKHLSSAMELADVMFKHFADPDGPGFFFVADDHEKLIARTKDLHDGSTPSGNAMAVISLLRLAKFLDRPEFASRAEETLRGYREMMTDHPAASGQMLVALDFHLGPVQEVVVFGKRDDSDTRAVLQALQGSFHPNRVLLFHNVEDSTNETAYSRPPLDLSLLKDRHMVNDTITVYVCENNTCAAPLVGLDAIKKSLFDQQ